VPVAVPVAGSPTMTSLGSMVQLAETGGGACSPPNINTTPLCSLTPLTSVAGTVELAPHEERQTLVSSSNATAEATAEERSLFRGMRARERKEQII